MAIQKTQTSDKVWQYLSRAGLTKAGIAGLMGNIYAESGMISNRVEILCLKRLKQNGYGNYTDESYTAAVDNGSISKTRFLNPIPKKQYGYGLCQWTSPSRKEKLYDLAKSKKKSIGNIEIQLEFLLEELKTSYKSVYTILTTTNSIKTASDKVLKDFEIPDNYSAYSATRAKYGQEYYNLYNTSTKTKEVKTQTQINFNNYYGKISNSGHDENNNYSSGKAGDQTGTEWEIRSWYSRPWNCVLRYPNIEVGKLLAELSIEAANNDLIGYDQNERYTYWDLLKVSNYRPSQITTANEADCSAGVIANTKAVGYLMNINTLKNISATYTGNMRQAYKNAGFKVLTENKYLNGYNYLLPGDILLNDVHHVAVNLGYGKNADSGSSSNQTSSTVSILEPADKLDKTLAGTYTVKTSDGLNLRYGAGLNKALVTTIPNNKKVQCYGYYSEVNNEKWLYIQYGEYIGYCNSKYLIKEKNVKKQIIIPLNTSEKINSTKKATGVVNYKSIYVRKWAGKEYEPLTSVPIIHQNDKIDICDMIKDTKNQNWYFAQVKPNIYGFVMAQYIDLK